MRVLVLPVLFLALPFLAAHGATSRIAEEAKAPRAHWEMDHYFYDESLHREWEVLVDRAHPDTPARMELVPIGKHKESERIARAAGFNGAKQNDASQPAFSAVCVRAGQIVEVSNAGPAPARILLEGVAMQTASPGQKIRVRLGSTGRFISAIVRGPHSVELAAPVGHSWRKR